MTRNLVFFNRLLQKMDPFIVGTESLPDDNSFAGASGPLHTQPRAGDVTDGCAHRAALAPRSRRSFSAALCAPLLGVLAGMGGTHSLARQPARIVLLETFDVPVVLEHTRHFVAVMEKLGYRKENIHILKAQGSADIADRILRQEVERHKPDVIVANATVAAKAAYPVAKAHGIPMVFFVVSDPVGAGIVPYLDAPSHDIVTGIVHSVPRDTKLEMVMRILRSGAPLGRPMRFGYLHTNYPSAVGDLAMLRKAAAQRNDVEFIAHQMPYQQKLFANPQTMAQLHAGIEALEPRIDYWWIAQDPTAEEEQSLRAMAQKSRHPIACGTNPVSIRLGALVYIAADTEVGAREAAGMVDQILKGTAAGNIPVHPPSRIDFGVNLDTARRMGVAIPSDLLELAGATIVPR